MLRLSVADSYGALTHVESTEWFTFKTIVVHNKKPRGGDDRTNLDRYSNLETMCNEMRGSRVATKPLRQTTSDNNNSSSEMQLLTIQCCLRSTSTVVLVPADA